ncbi:effector-binding domain-containing protein [Lentzea nigeriaca]|nr:effector-binding domain-containing protein [Lentzea nigeriaca]
MHPGRHEGLTEAYEVVFAWLHGHGNHQAGPLRERYLAGPDTVSDPADHLTEIVLPVRGGA